MALSQRRISIDKCPDISAESKKLLSEISRPPMKAIKFGMKDNEIELGGEEVLFRHEKTFYHQPAFAILLSDTVSSEEFRKTIKKLMDMKFELLGENIKIDMLAIKNDSKNPDAFVQCVQLAKDFPLLLMSEKLETVKKARAVLGNQTPVIMGGFSKAWIQFALESGSILVIQGKSLDEIAEKSKQAQSHGLNNIILYPEVQNIKEALMTFTQSWRMALEKNFQPLGFPVMGKAGKALALAANFICKYAGIIILEITDYQDLLPIIVLRFNIYTDPRTPLMMDPKLYEIGRPEKTSPILVTTNFSLTFYMVHSALVNSHIPSYLLITESDGLSVLSAWAGDKFNTEIIIRSLKNSGIEEKVVHRKIVIPGCVASLKAKLEDKSGWEVLIGPAEASLIPQFLKTHWK